MKKSLHDLYEESHYNFGSSSSDFYRFLISFNQDTESFDIGLKEYINEAIRDPERKSLKSKIQGIEEFLKNEDYTDDEKEEFIYSEIDLDISVLGITHLEWLRQIVLPEMKRNL